jgi:hypothetical protein
MLHSIDAVRVNLLTMKVSVKIWGETTLVQTLYQLMEQGRALFDYLLSHFLLAEGLSSAYS